METNSVMMAGVMGALAFQKGIGCNPQHDSQLMGMALQVDRLVLIALEISLMDTQRRAFSANSAHL